MLWLSPAFGTTWNAADMDQVIEAVEQAIDGDVVVLDPLGSYVLDQDRAVDKALTFTTPGPRATVDMGPYTLTYRKDTVIEHVAFVGDGTSPLLWVNPADSPDVQLVDVRLEGGGDDEGSAVRFSGGGVLELQAVEVVGNTSIRGAVWVDGGQLIVTGSSFTDNVADGATAEGAAIRITGDAHVTITQSTFEDNENRTHAGGAIAWIEARSPGSLALESSTFTGNTSVGLGASLFVWRGDVPVKLVDNTFADGGIVVACDARTTDPFGCVVTSVGNRFDGAFDTAVFLRGGTLDSTDDRFQGGRLAVAGTADATFTRPSMCALDLAVEGKAAFLNPVFVDVTDLGGAVGVDHGWFLRVGSPGPATTTTNSVATDGATPPGARLVPSPYAATVPCPRGDELRPTLPTALRGQATDENPTTDPRYLAGDLGPTGGPLAHPDLWSDDDGDGHPKVWDCDDADRERFPDIDALTGELSCPPLEPPHTGLPPDTGRPSPTEPPHTGQPPHDTAATSLPTVGAGCRCGSSSPPSGAWLPGILAWALRRRDDGSTAPRPPRRPPAPRLPRPHG